MTRLVILDRDGVINRDSDAYIKSLAEWHPYPSAIDAIALLSRSGWTIAIATNQSGIGRGYYGLDTLSAIHARLRELVALAGGRIEMIAYCPHLPEDGCDCRKPKPGMLLDIQHRLGVDPPGDECWMVGDSPRDIEAGIAAGCRTALVRTGNGSRCEGQIRDSYPDTWICKDLAAFTHRLLHPEKSR